jgi:hypothetical protein
MLNQREFDHWCRQMSISQEARSIIEEIRSREPIRRVKSSGINVPWATVLIDAMSRRILAVYLTFDEPSYRSCMMVLRR